MIVLGSRASIGGVLGQGRGGASNGLLTGLVAYWGLDEASGNALDKHSGGLTLTQSGSPGASTGIVYATARTFTGSSQYFSRTSETALQVGGGQWGCAIWMYPTSAANYQMTVGKATNWTTTSGWEFVVAYMGGTDTANLYVASATSYTALAGASGISKNAWNLISAWRGGGNIYLAVNDGTPISRAWSDSNTYTNNDPFVIAKSQGGAYFAGRIGPVMLWKNRTLSADDRTALYNGAAGLAYSAFS